MPGQETPPSSPSISATKVDEDDDMQPLDENDIIEVLEDDMEGDANDSDNDDDNIAGEDIDKEEDAVVVEEEERTPERDDAKLIFMEHREGVLTCEFHPECNNIVASGGMDDVAYMWDSGDGNKLFTCKGHEESIEVVSFSRDGSYLATADLNGVIKIWRTKDYTLITTFELEDELGWLNWHHGTNVLVAASQSGMVYMYKIPSGETKMVVASYGQSCPAGKILPDGRSLVCGYRDGSLKIVDLREGTVLKDVKPLDDIGGITCLDVQKTNNLIICGCTSGAVILISANNGKIVSFLQGVQNSDGNGYIEAVSFCKDAGHQVAASGSLDGKLIIWDVVKQMPRHKYNFSSCINHLAWHPTFPVIFTCHFEGVIRAFDAKAGVVLREYLGHQKSCLNMSLSGDGSLLMTTSEDKTVRIFSVGDMSQRV